MRKKLFVALVLGLMIVPFIMGTATAKTLKIGSTFQSWLPSTF